MLERGYWMMQVDPQYTCLFKFIETANGAFNWYIIYKDDNVLLYTCVARRHYWKQLQQHGWNIQIIVV